MTANQYATIGLIYCAYHITIAWCMNYSQNAAHTTIIAAMHFAMVMAQIVFSLTALYKHIAEIYAEMK